MTVIAWDGKRIAADRRACSDSRIETRQKLFPVIRGDGTWWIACCGCEDHAEILRDWFISGGDPDKFPEKQQSKGDNESITFMFAMAPDSSLYCYQRSPIPCECLDKFMAWGTGGDIALGAMAMGADAVKAVEIACTYDNMCGNGIDASL